MKSYRMDLTAGASLTTGKNTQIVFREQKPQTFHTEFVGYEGVCLHPLTELVGLTTNQHRHVKSFGHQSNLRSPNSRHDVAVGQESVSAKEHL